MATIVPQEGRALIPLGQAGAPLTGLGPILSDHFGGQAGLELHVLRDWIGTYSSR